MFCTKYRVIANDVSGYINLLVRIAHIICNHPIYWLSYEILTLLSVKNLTSIGTSTIVKLLRPYVPVGT
jgi:hypothetical protein